MVIYLKRRVGTIIALFKIISNLFKMTGGKDERMNNGPKSPLYEKNKTP